MRPRSALSILFLTILLMMARILVDAPTGRSKVSDLFPEHDQNGADHAIVRAVAIDDSTWQRAETVTIQALIVGGVGLLGTAAAFYFAGKASVASREAQSERNNIPWHQE